MINKGVCNTIGMRDVWAQTDVRCRFLLNNEIHVPDIHLNLILIKTLDIGDYHTYFGSDVVCNIAKDH